MAEHVTTEELAAQYGVRRKTVDQWGRRGHVTILERSDGARVVDPEQAARWWNEERDARMAAVRASRP